jgi:hypothetical protein
MSGMLACVGRMFALFLHHVHGLSKNLDTPWMSNYIYMMLLK